MLGQEKQVFFTISFPKSMDRTYVARNMRQSYNLLAIDHFSDLLQPIAQTYELNT